MGFNSLRRRLAFPKTKPYHICPPRRSDRGLETRRLSTSLGHLVETVQELERRGIGFRSLTEGLDTSNSGGKAIFPLFAAIASVERTLIQERTRAGMRGEGVGRSAVPSRADGECSADRTAWAAADARFRPSGSRSEAWEDRYLLVAPRGLHIPYECPPHIAWGTAGEVQQESGPAARVDELGSWVFSPREHNSNQDARCFPSIRLA
jgi:hypothetical protein